MGKEGGVSIADLWDNVDGAMLANAAHLPVGHEVVSQSQAGPLAALLRRERVQRVRRGQMPQYAMPVAIGSF